MANDNAVIYYEASQTAVTMAALMDSGDHKFFESAGELWSNASGAEAVVRPDGVASGGAITPGAADQVAVAALTCYQGGALRIISAVEALDVARPTLANAKYSIVIDGSQAVTAIKGTESASAVSDVRGAEGGPPLIPVGQIEIGQIHITSADSGVYTASEIKQIVGVHMERFDFPTWTEKRMNVVNNVAGAAGVEFTAALPPIHTGGVSKTVYASYFEPDFAEVPDSSDFTPPETTHSTSSTQIYGKTLGAASSTLGQGSFTAYLKDGVTDALLSKKNENIFFKFKPDRLKTPYILCQGKLGVARSFPAGDNITAACTVSATEGAVEVTS
ncbi:hypothetical protein [Desulfoluna spongiiphila]|uniref:Uncharacterized protein n=1 Tax=Desulfoluna spongiiphila TaxID=419481 RepID=A0A1G5FZX1_9BACT|nr:hypothetical protein [Desulfoluna spongiiphila]SCY44714.1 hypothetical protein SAMN05216233_109110 [Desulfoluna spongiiphila]VVS95354.1 hypothetical protein DBB_49310 [Desulfoluna spongiiphila]